LEVPDWQIWRQKRVNQKTITELLQQGRLGSATERERVFQKGMTVVRAMDLESKEEEGKIKGEIWSNQRIWSFGGEGTTSGKFQDNFHTKGSNEELRQQATKIRESKGGKTGSQKKAYSPGRIKRNTWDIAVLKTAGSRSERPLERLRRCKARNVKKRTSENLFR